MANFIAKETEKKPEFSILMWIGKIAIVLVLTVIIAVFYFDQFSMKQAIPYMGALLFIGSMSIALTKYHDSPDDRFKMAAFVSSVVLILLMAINAAICFGVGRDMNVATEETERSEKTIKDCRDRYEKQLAGKLGPQARLKAIEGYNACGKTAEGVQTRQQIYGKKDSLLYWVMMAEFGAASIVLLVLIGLVVFKNHLGIAQQEIHRDDLAAEIAVRRELAAKQRQEVIDAIRAGQMTNGSGKARTEVLATGHVDARSGGGPDADPSRLAIGTRATGDDGDKWIVRDTGGQRDWMRDTASLPSPTPSQNTTQIRQNEAKGHFRYDPPSLSSYPAETRSQSHRVATQNTKEATRVATQTPLETLREALRQNAKQGHFFFNAEKKRNHIFVRQMVSEGSVAEAMASHTMDLEFLDFAQAVIDGERTMAEFVGDVREDLEAAGFDLEEGRR